MLRRGFPISDYIYTALDRHLSRILSEVPIPDDPEELNWRAFFAHSQDMQGFRADIFTGGPNEADNPHDLAYRGLRDRWKGTSTELIDDLSRGWNDRGLCTMLSHLTGPNVSRVEKQNGTRPVIARLCESPIPGVRIFGEALNDLRGDRIARKTNKMIRSYLQNADYLAKHYDSSMREFLLDRKPLRSWIATVEQSELQTLYRLERQFFNVGPTLATYLICDWLLGLWDQRIIDWFTAYKADSVFMANMNRQGILPAAAASDFVSYCRTITLPNSAGPHAGRPCPPRILNECIWLDFNKSSEPMERSFSARR